MWSPGVLGEGLGVVVPVEHENPKGQASLPHERPVGDALSAPARDVQWCKAQSARFHRDSGFGIYPQPNDPAVAGATDHFAIQHVFCKAVLNLVERRLEAFHLQTTRLSKLYLTAHNTYVKPGEHCP